MTDKSDGYTEEQYQAVINAMGDAIGVLIVGLNNAVYLANEAIAGIVPYKTIIMDAYKERLKEQGIDMKEVSDEDLSEQLFGKVHIGDDDDSLVM